MRFSPARRRTFTDARPDAQLAESVPRVATYETTCAVTSSSTSRPRCVCLVFTDSMRGASEQMSRAGCQMPDVARYTPQSQPKWHWVLRIHSRYVGRLSPVCHTKSVL